MHQRILLRKSKSKSHPSHPFTFISQFLRLSRNLEINVTSPSFHPYYSNPGLLSSYNRSAQALKDQEITPHRLHLTYMMSNHSNQDLEDLREQLGQTLEETDLGYMRSMMGDDNSIDDNTDDDTYRPFKINIPPPQQPVEIEEIEEETPPPSSWFPHENKSTEEGRATNLYLDYMEAAIETPTEVFEYFKQAEILSDKMGCFRTTALWRELSPLLTIGKRLQMVDTFSDLAYYIRYRQDHLHPYLKAMRNMKGHLKPATESIQAYEARISGLHYILEELLCKLNNRQDETEKFAQQVNNASKSLAGLQEVMEASIIKISKLDILPSEVGGPSSVLSIPTTPTTPKGERVRLVSFEVDGEYVGLFNFKIQDGRIVSLTPPSSNPEIKYITQYTKKAQEVWINLNMTEVLNKMSELPELKRAFTQPPEIGQQFFRRICMGVRNKEYQWIKEEN